MAALAQMRGERAGHHEERGLFLIVRERGHRGGISNGGLLNDGLLHGRLVGVGQRNGRNGGNDERADEQPHRKCQKR